MIEDKAKELGRLIGQSAEYKAVKRANEALNQDKDAVALLQQAGKAAATRMGDLLGRIVPRI